MRRFIVCLLTFGTTLALLASTLHAQSSGVPKLNTLAVPGAHARSLATKLSLRYRDVPGVQISPDARNERLIVMAPEAAQQKIAAELRGMLSSTVQQVSAQSGPLNVHLAHITWREFEDELQRVEGRRMPVTTSRSGERAAYQLTSKPLQGTTIEVDRRNNTVTVIAPQPSLPGWQKMISALDKTPSGPDTVTELIRLDKAEPAPIQRALRLLQALESNPSEGFAATAVGGSPFRNAVFQQGVGGQEVGGQVPPAGTPDGEAIDEEGGAGVIGDTQIQFVPELGTIIIRGSKRDVQRVMDVIKEIEEKSKLTQPEVEVLELEHADANAVAALLQQLYEDVLSARQGDVSITSLDVPNALLLIGRKEAILGLMDLIKKIDQPVSESSRLRVFRLRNASAVDAEQTIRDFFTDRPGSDDNVRPGIGPRVRVQGDYRTNSLIISAAPRDMVEITRLINELDVEEHSARNEIKVFQLNNAIAEELAPVLQTAINGEGEEVNDNITLPSSNLSIVAVDSDGNQTVDSGILTGAVVTADPGANAIVVRAPAASMPLIAELIRQLDKTPGIDSLVKVFTVQNGDATQLTTALRDLFGDDAATLGTSVGAGNTAGLPPSTAGTESSLVPLRFSTDIRTNSIIASGAAEDLEVVESILIRLDSEGFAERITEVIWLRHQPAVNVATAMQDYIQQRTTSVNQIQQFQQGGLGPFDLPDRDLVVASEGQTNSVLISVSPRIYEEVRAMIDKLDRRPPMVLIKTMIAEVRLDDTFEIGGEVGLQDSLLYDRGVAAGGFPGATPPSNPGFNFNGNGTPNNNSFRQGTLAASTVSTFGVGTTNSTVGYGGFVLSAASDSVSLLLRTLQDASRLQILSRPQIMTMDNTDGFVQVGRVIARVTDVINSGISGTQLVTDDLEVGIIMRIQPRVGADGLIVMTIDATRSDRDDSNGTLVPTPDGVVLINDILQTTAQSTIAAYSGQTVIFGGLIQKSRANFSRRVPIVADIPLLGHFFKYDQEAEIRSELLVFMTPYLVNGDEDMDYVKSVESSRMSWCLADVVEAHGDEGLSGGYGLWGPAVGNTIYPDIQPTVDDIIVPESYQSTPAMGGDANMIDSAPVIQEAAPVVPAQNSLPAPVAIPPGTLPPPSAQGNATSGAGRTNVQDLQGTGQALVQNRAATYAPSLAAAAIPPSYAKAAYTQASGSLMMPQATQQASANLPRQPAGSSEVVQQSSPVPANVQDATKSSQYTGPTPTTWRTPSAKQTTWQQNPASWMDLSGEHNPKDTSRPQPHRLGGGK